MLVGFAMLAGTTAIAQEKSPPPPDHIVMLQRQRLKALDGIVALLEKQAEGGVQPGYTLVEAARRRSEAELAHCDDRKSRQAAMEKALRFAHEQRMRTAALIKAGKTKHTAVDELELRLLEIDCEIAHDEFLGKDAAGRLRQRLEMVRDLCRLLEVMALEGQISGRRLVAAERARLVAELATSTSDKERLRRRAEHTGRLTELHGRLKKVLEHVPFPKGPFLTRDDVDEFDIYRLEDQISHDRLQGQDVDKPQRQRCDALRVLSFSTHKRLWSGGDVPPGQEYLTVRQAHVTAELELAKTPAERLERLEGWERLTREHASMCTLLLEKGGSILSASPSVTFWRYAPLILPRKSRSKSKEPRLAGKNSAPRALIRRARQNSAWASG